METIWTGSYSNCDYGYRVLLPAGALGHNGLPPSPNHGFYVNLAMPGSDEPTATSKFRMLWVWNAYVVEDSNPYTDALRTKSGVKKLKNGRIYVERPVITRMGSLPAVRTRRRFVDARNGSDAITEEVIALSGDRTIEYRVTLNTSSTTVQQDEKFLNQILAGFQTTAIKNTACSND